MEVETAEKVANHGSFLEYENDAILVWRKPLAEEGNRRHLAAILAADVEGYSRLMGADEMATVRSLRSHRQITDKLIAEHGGRIANTAGDSIIAEFASATDAVRAACDIQSELAPLNAELPVDRQVRFRIGVNLGEVIAEGDDVLGDGVNIAARLEGLSEPGGVCIARSVYDQVSDKLHYGYEYLGEHQLKNIAEPVRAYRVSPTATVRVKPDGRRHHTPRRMMWSASLACAMVLVAWFLVPKFLLRDAERPPALENPKLSIAVLPFANLSGEQHQDYFADALTEDLTADLSRIAGSFVISRRTAATYRGRNVDAKQIAQELKVRYLLEGTVRRARNDVRVSVQLTEGETGQQVWAERYEKTAGDIYTFQNEVTGRVARTLNLELKEALSRQAARRRNVNLDADDLALRAWAELWNKPQSRTTNDAALGYVNQALTIEPDHAEALGVAAYAYARAANYGWGMSRAEGIAKGIAVGEKSVALDPKNADAVYSLGFLYYIAGDTKKSTELMRQCIELNRNHVPAYFFYGLNLLRLGRPQETVAWVQRAFRLSPRDPLRSVWYGVASRALLLTGEEERAIEEASKGVTANKNHGNNYAVLAAANAHLGRLDEAKVAIEKLKIAQPGITIGRFLHRVAGDDPIAIETYRHMIEGLRKAGLTE